MSVFVSFHWTDGVDFPFPVDIRDYDVVVRVEWTRTGQDDSVLSDEPAFHCAGVVEVEFLDGIVRLQFDGRVVVKDIDIVLGSDVTVVGPAVVFVDFQYSVRTEGQVLFRVAPYLGAVGEHLYRTAGGKEGE